MFRSESMVIPGRVALLKALGFGLGAVLGMAILGSIGLLALDHSRGLLWGLAFFVSFVGMLFGIVGPLALVRYLGGRGGSRIAKELSTAGGYVAIIVVTVGVAAAAFFLAPAGLRNNPQTGLVVFDLVAGAVFGGIIGLNAVAKRV
ncbi:MAG: hypothetical protein ABEH59_06740 [Halobacteriales archaeon]